MWLFIHSNKTLTETDVEHTKKLLCDPGTVNFY